MASRSPGETGDSYLTDAIATGQAVATHLSDANGVYADLQAENDIVEPLIEAMDDLATTHQCVYVSSLLNGTGSPPLKAVRAVHMPGRSHLDQKQEVVVDPISESQ